MNIIQTLYIDNNKDPFKDSFGWVKPEFHLMGWALSCLQLKKFYNKVELYCNSDAAKLLIDVLDLPYDKVNISHNNLHLINKDLWAIPKIFTYSLQEKPFLHIDGDVFIFSPFPETLLEKELIAQNPENATLYYTTTQDELMKHFQYFPSCVKRDFWSSIPIKGVNAGILGGNNIPFIKEYTKEAFEYINKNVKYFPSVNNLDRFNVFFEQHLFYSLAKDKNTLIDFLIDDVINDVEYKYLGNFHEVPFRKSYLHLLGHFKRDEFTCLQMAAKLRELYPEYYYKIIAIFNKKNIQLTYSFFDKTNYTQENLQDFHEKAINCYLSEIGESHLVPNDLDYESSQDMKLLKNIFNTYCENTNITFDIDKLSNDFLVFSENLMITLKRNSKMSDNYYYGRDIAAVNWYQELFSIEGDFQNKIITKSEGLDIIESEFDWAGLMNKYSRVGVEYYENLELSKGLFFNLVVPEVYTKKYSLIDIDEFEKEILNQLSHPMSIKNLLLEMQLFVDDDVIQNHLNEFNNLVIEFIKQLVIKKVIRPARL
jgi:hypothetical protein